MDGFFKRLQRSVIDALVDENLEMEKQRTSSFQSVAVLLQVVDDPFGFPQRVTSAGNQKVKHVMFGDKRVQAMVHGALSDVVRISKNFERYHDIISRFN